MLVPYQFPVLLTLQCLLASTTAFSYCSKQSLSSATILFARHERRELFHTAIQTFVALGITSTSTLNVDKARALASDEVKRDIVAVIGGGGRTGMAVAETLASNGILSVTLTRDGSDPFRIIRLPEATKDNLLHYPKALDVRDKSELEAALKDIGATCVVFAASASKRGGSSLEVDEEGAGNAAVAAKATGSRLLLISALAVDRPDSQSFQITNSLGGNFDKIMDAKRNGEDKVRDIMGRGKGNYVIIRPGVLLNGKTRAGALDLELNQGDTVGGGLSRDELAGIVLGAVQSDVKGVTVEAYRKSTKTKLQPEFSLPSGNELISDTYQGFFKGAKTDL